LPSVSLSVASLNCISIYGLNVTSIQPMSQQHLRETNVAPTKSLLDDANKSELGLTFIAIRK